VPETVYFLGAGASQEAGIPTQKELWDRVLTRWEKTGDENIKEVLDFAVYLNFGESIRSVQVDFAEFLTLIDLALEQNVSLGKFDVGRLRKIRYDTIKSICQILENSVEHWKKEKLLSFCQRLAPSDPIISLNYDTMMDGLINETIGAVSYGFHLTPLSQEDTNPQGQLILKPHGSLNWHYCGRCNSVFLSSLRTDGGNFSDRLKCLNDGNFLEQVLVTPSYEKKFLVPQLHEVWYQCFCRLKEATRIFFIGYSFPPGDIHLIYLIKRAVLAGGKKPEINIVARDSYGTVHCRCRHIFAKFNYFNMSFSDFLQSGLH
jgi:hypothetical protein